MLTKRDCPFLKSGFLRGENLPYYYKGSSRPNQDDDEDTDQEEIEASIKWCHKDFRTALTRYVKKQ